VFSGDPAVGQNADGRLEVFVRGNDRALYHRWQVAPGGAWSGWAALNGASTSDISVARNTDGRLELFTLGMDKALWHRWQTAPSGGWN
jgi:hypothetical protein